MHEPTARDRDDLNRRMTTEGGGELGRAAVRLAEADAARERAQARRDEYEAAGRWGRALAATVSYYGRALAHERARTRHRMLNDAEDQRMRGVARASDPES